MKKQKKFKHWPAVLIPIFSVAAVSAVVVPMSILNTSHYVTIPVQYMNWGVGKADKYQYPFVLKDNLKEGQHIVVTTKKHKFYNTNYWLEPLGEPQVSEKSLIVDMIFKSSVPGQDTGNACFDVFFTCYDANNKIVWQDKIQAMRCNVG